MSRVLVTDGEQRAALALTRSLGRRGDAVVVTSGSGRSLAGASRYAQVDVSIPDPARDPTGYAAAIERAVRTRGIDVLIPVTELSLRVLLPVRDRMGHAAVPFPSIESFSKISDKAWLVERATRLGVPTPPQCRIECAGALAEAEPRVHALGFPVVLKPARSVVQSGNGARSLGVTYARDAAELRHLVESFPPEAFPLLLQHRIVGPGAGLFLLLWDGDVRAVFGHRRIREMPPSGGVSVCRESIPADPVLVDLSLRLLRDVGWQGVAMVEFKIDASTGSPYLIEVNGRFWGSLQLAVDAGVDFPALLMDAVEGRPAPPVPVTSSRHVRTRWMWGEVDHVLSVLRGRSAPSDGRGGSSRRLRAALSVLGWRPGDHTEVLRWSDPRPFFLETARWMGAARRSVRW